MRKKILVTGGAGYIGCVLIKHLLNRGYSVRAFDILFFGMEPIKELLGNPFFELIRGDLCNVEQYTHLFDDIYGILHLAAISDDNSSNLLPLYTFKINYECTVKLARLAKEKRIKRFIFSSSCSVYGFGTEKILEEKSILNPLSRYAETKILAEKDILKLYDKNFIITILRNATAFGYSPRMRFDLVLNHMIKTAFTDNKIFVHGGGKQWRPLVHVDDISTAFIKCLEAPSKIINGEIFNVGSNEQNYQIEKLAEIIQYFLPNNKTEVINEIIDKRDYSVSFKKIKRILGFNANKKVQDGIIEISDKLKTGKLIDLDNIKYYNVRTMKKLFNRDIKLRGV